MKFDRKKIAARGKEISHYKWATLPNPLRFEKFCANHFSSSRSTSQKPCDHIPDHRPNPGASTFQPTCAKFTLTAFLLANFGKIDAPTANDLTVPGVGEKVGHLRFTPTVFELTFMV